MTVWRQVQGWNTEGQPAGLTILLGDPAPHPEGGYACDFLMSGLLRRSPAKRASGVSPEEACDAARQAAVAEIVYYNSLWTDDVPQCIAGEGYFLADYSKAEYWLRLAADAGSPQACGTLADLLCFSPWRARDRSYYAAPRPGEYGFPEELRGGPLPRDEPN